MFNFLKKKEKKIDFEEIEPEKKIDRLVPPPAPAGKELDIPPAPPSEEDLPEFPELPEFGGRLEPEKPKIPKLTLPKPKKPSIPQAEKLEKKAFKEEKFELEELEEHKESVKPVFVKMEMFQSMINELNLIKNVAKESDEAIARVGDFAQDQEKEFNKWQSQLVDIQKKLIFVDKTMFK